MGAAAGFAIGAAALNYLGSKKQADAAGTASNRSERARRESMVFLTPEHLSIIGNWLFPGLLPGGADGSGAPRTGFEPTTVPVPRFLRGATTVTGQKVGSTATAFQSPTLPSSPTTPGGVPRPLNAPGRAFGGPVSQNKPYVVGERGPELFVPQAPGQIQPNLAAGTPAAGGVPAQSGTAAQPQQPQLGVQGGATTVPEPTAPPLTGELAVQRNMEFLQNPGQLTPATYERTQEQTAKGLNTSLMGIQGQLTGQGIDPNTPMGQALAAAAVATANKQNVEAARDYSLAQEELRRADVSAGISNYLDFLKTILGFGSAQSAAAGGQQFPQVAAINPYEGLARGIAQLGYGLSQTSKDDSDEGQ